MDQQEIITEEEIKNNVTVFYLTNKYSLLTLFPDIIEPDTKVLMSEKEDNGIAYNLFSRILRNDDPEIENSFKDSFQEGYEGWLRTFFNHRTEQQCYAWGEGSLLDDTIIIAVEPPLQDKLARMSIPCKTKAVPITVSFDVDNEEIINTMIEWTEEKEDIEDIRIKGEELIEKKLEEQGFDSLDLDSHAVDYGEYEIKGYDEEGQVVGRGLISY